MSKTRTDISWPENTRRLAAHLDRARRLACRYYAAAIQGDDNRRGAAVSLFGEDVAAELYDDGQEDEP